MNPVINMLFGGFISVLISIIGFFVVRYIKRQDSKNDSFFNILDKNEQAITRLNTTLELNDKLYNERHQNHEQRISKLEAKTR